METHNFALRDGKIVYVPDVPDSADFVDQADDESHYDDKGYEQALQSAIANGIEVINKDDVLDIIFSSDILPKNEYGRKIWANKQLYPLQCRVEVGDRPLNSCKSCNDIGVWHCAHPEECGQIKIGQVARVTFEQPENKVLENCARIAATKNALFETGYAPADDERYVSAYNNYYKGYLDALSIDTKAVELISELCENLEMQLGRLGVSLHGDGQGRSADNDSYGGFGLLLKAREFLKNSLPEAAGQEQETQEQLWFEVMEEVDPHSLISSRPIMHALRSKFTIARKKQN